MFIRWDHPNRLRTYTDDRRSADQRCVALVAHIHRWLHWSSSSFTCCHEAIETCSRASAREKTSSSLWISYPTSEPIHHYDLEHTWSARAQPRSLKDVMPSSHEISQDSWPSWRRGHKSEKARVVYSPCDRKNLMSRTFDNLLCRPTFLRRFLAHNRFKFRPRSTTPRRFVR